MVAMLGIFGNNSRKPIVIILVVIMAAFWFLEKTQKFLQYGLVFYQMGLECEGSCGLNKKKELFQKAVHYNGNLIDAYFQLALVYEQMGKHEEAFNSFKRVTELDYQNGLAYYMAGLHYFQSGNYDNALRYFLRANKQRGCPDDMIYFLARIYDQMKEYRLALDYYKGFAARFPGYTNTVCPRIIEISRFISEFEGIPGYISYIRTQNLNDFADELDKCFKAAQEGGIHDK